MDIKVNGKTYQVGYALWKLSKLEGESNRQFLNRAIAIDNVMRECDDARMATVAAENRLVRA